MPSAPACKSSSEMNITNRGEGETADGGVQTLSGPYKNYSSLMPTELKIRIKLPSYLSVCSPETFAPDPVLTLLLSPLGGSRLVLTADLKDMRR